MIFNLKDRIHPWSYRKVYFTIDPCCFENLTGVVILTVISIICFLKNMTSILIVSMIAITNGLGYPHAFFVRFRFLIFEFLEALLTFQAVSLAYLPLLLLSSYQELNQRYRSRHGCNKMIARWMQQNDATKWCNKMNARSLCVRTITNTHIGWRV